MKATGIVRRIDAGIIIGQTVGNPHKHKDFHWFARLNTRVSKTGFRAFFEEKFLTKNSIF